MSNFFAFYIVFRVLGFFGAYSETLDLNYSVPIS